MSKFAFETRAKQPVDQDTFNAWSKNNFYRTSYGSHYTNFPNPPKNVAYPGYAGFVPTVVSSNLYGKSYSPLTRQAFSNTELGHNKHKLSSTGFNFKPEVHLDHNMAPKLYRSIIHALGYIREINKYKQGDRWQTQSQASFRHPKSVVNPTFRETDRNLQTAKEFTRHSGFSQNHKQFDGNGWLPDPILHSDMVRTEYRINYNQEKPFHRNPVSFKMRKIKPTEYNYKHT